MRFALMTFLITMFSGLSLAQEDSLRYVSISGLIKDEVNGEILRGVKIYNETREYGSLSKSNGFYTIVAVTGDIIRFSAVGYAPLYMQIEEEARTREIVSVNMEQSDVYIEEVVVGELPALDQLNAAFMALDIDDDPGRELASRNPDTFNILDNIDTPAPRGPVSFLKKHVFDKIKQKKRKPGKAKKLPKYE